MHATTFRGLGQEEGKGGGEETLKWGLETGSAGGTIRWEWDEELVLQRAYRGSMC